MREHFRRTNMVSGDLGIGAADADYIIVVLSATNIRSVKRK